MATGPLPQTGDSQDIGADAERCLWARGPRAWRLHNLGGTDDYGLDFQVQIAIDQQITDIFRIQLKGTRKPLLSADNTFFSVDFQASTLRYYSRIVEPVLLVLCNLAAAEDPVDCPLHYVWIQDELSRINVGDLSSAQKSVVLRIPVANRLSRATDLRAELEAQNELSRAGLALDIKISRKKTALRRDERLSLVGGILTGIETRGPAFLDALAAPAEGYWIDPDKGSLAWHLREAVRFLRSDHFRHAAIQLANAEEKIEHAVGVEIAEYWSLKGKLATALDDDEAAAEYFRRAIDTGSRPEHVAAWAEAELRVRHSTGKAEYEDLLQALNGEEAEVVCLKSRVLAISNRFTEAVELSNSIDGALRYAALAIVRSIEGKYSEAASHCTEGLALVSLAENVRQLLMVILARCKFIEAVPNSLDEKLPPTGTITLDPNLVREAWKAIDDAIQSLHGTGWSNNIAQLVDIWSATAVILNKQAEVLPVLISIAMHRPNSIEIQQALEFLAIQCGDFEQAITANNNLPLADSRELRRVMHLHEAEKHRACADLFERVFDSTDKTHGLFGPAATLACLSAYKLSRPEYEKWSAYLRSSDRWQVEVALLEYYISLERNPLGADAALSQLRVRYKALNEPFELAATLILGADPTDVEGARLCIEMGNRLEQEARLWYGAAMKVAWALATVQNWDGLLSHCERHGRQMDVGQRLQAFEAVALDKIGRVSEARQLLERLLASGSKDVMALNTYVDISIRCGFDAEAISAIERMLELSSSDHQRIECIRLIFRLVQNSDATSPKLLTLAKSMAMLANPAVEAQEGTYLVMFLTATLSENVTPSAEALDEFRSRANSFFSRFPNSTIMRRGSVRNKASIKEILADFEDLAGNSEKRQAVQAKMERAMQKGFDLLPFAFRPKLVLASIADVVHLWCVCKRSSREDRQYHLAMQVNPNWTAKPLESMRIGTPLFDLISLLVLSDLTLLDLAIDFFGKVAITKATLRELAGLAAGFWGSPVRMKCIELQNSLKKRFGSILQPSSAGRLGAGVEDEEDEDEEDSPLDSLEELKELCTESSTYRLYSDDLFFRQYCLEGRANDGLCTLDLLSALEEDGVISERDRVAAIARLCDWKVGVTVRYEDLMVLIYDDLRDVRDLRSAIEKLEANGDLAKITGAIWDIQHPLERLVMHGAAVLRRIAEEGRLSAAAVAGFMASLFVKIQLRADAPKDSLVILCDLFVAAVAQSFLRSSVAGLLWRVFAELMLFYCGYDMKKEKLLEGIVRLGGRFAQFESEVPGAGVRAVLWLNSGLVRNSETSKLFMSSYGRWRTHMEPLRGRAPNAVG